MGLANWQGKHEGDHNPDQPIGLRPTHRANTLFRLQIYNTSVAIMQVLVQLSDVSHKQCPEEM